MTARRRHLDIGCEPIGDVDEKHYPLHRNEKEWREAEQVSMPIMATDYSDQLDR
jgi:hypothetical protein